MPKKSKEEDAPPPKPISLKPKVNPYTAFDESQINQFKECFTLMDINRDGFLDETDLEEIYMQTGREPEPKIIKAMIAEAPKALDFKEFLQLFADMLHGTDSETSLREAFFMFDPSKGGIFDAAWFKEMLTDVGDQFTPEEIKLTWKEAPIESGKFNYMQLIRWIKDGKEDNDDDD